MLDVPFDCSWQLIDSWELFCVEFTNLARTYMTAQALFAISNIVTFVAHTILSVYYTPGIKCTEVNLPQTSATVLT